jgi:hypothetical protein
MGVRRRGNEAKDKAKQGFSKLDLISQGIEAEMISS